MAETVYVLCALTSSLCAFLLLRSYWNNRSNLLFWSGLCFLALAASNVVLVVDLVVYPDTEFYGALIRSGLTAVAGLLLLYGLIWELT
jgi:hypothetical protein